MSEKVIEFYNHFKNKQINTGINIRHRTILKNLKKEGLKPFHQILEIGCGIGTVTKLLSRYASKGHILAVDISPESIEFAKKFVTGKNVTFLVSDMSDFKQNQLFDFIILPDVLEHIPLENHYNLFKNLSQCCKATTTVFINIPSPHFQKFVSKNTPHLQQIIDLEVHSDVLLKNAYENGFYLLSLNTYSLGYQEGDYQKIVLKRKDGFGMMNKISYLKLVWAEIKSKLPF